MIEPLWQASSESLHVPPSHLCPPNERSVTEITYIGIPLAVLGVMPLLWNMVKSFIILFRLLSSLSIQERKDYSLIMDPAAGSVSVGVDTPKLHFEILWRSLSPAFPSARWVS